MPWMLGIDEAGYGPNLGPFVMTCVRCRLPDAGADPWQLLADILRKGGGRADGRVVVDDSKVVFASGKGLSGLERGVLPLFALSPCTLGELTAHLCGGAGELCGEAWFSGDSPVPADADAAELASLGASLNAACEAAGIGGWRARSVIVCPPRFNELTQEADSKSAVLAEGFVRLLADALAAPDIQNADDIHVHIDKQGGRNTYAPQIQQALPAGMVLATEERAARSRYRVAGLERKLELTFEPRADGRWMCVALASMVSKYLRELLMGEFNRFWQRHVPGLKPTAGYPGDAPRFLEAIRPAAATLRIPEAAIWRER